MAYEKVLKLIESQRLTRDGEIVGCTRVSEVSRCIKIKRMSS